MRIPILIITARVVHVFRFYLVAVRDIRSICQSMADGGDHEIARGFSYELTITVAMCLGDLKKKKLPVWYN